MCHPIRSRPYRNLHEHERSQHEPSHRQWPIRCFFIKIGCTTIVSLSLTTKSFGTIATYEEITTIDSGYRLSLTKKLTCLHCKVVHRPAYTKSELSDTHRFRNKCITAGSFTRNSFSTGHPHDRLRPDWLLLLATCGQQGRQTHHEKCVS